MEEKDFKELLDRYNANKCNEEERIFIESWYNQWNPGANTLLTDEKISASVDKIWEVLQDQIQPAKVRKIWPRIAAAASLILLIGAGSYLYLSKQKTGISQASFTKNHIRPGSNTAVLTLANGKRLALGTPGANRLTQQGQVQLTEHHGELIYTVKAGQNTADTSSAINQVETPNGGQYQVVLADGSKVWLNALSSLRFPVSFKGKYRKVAVTGEAYFEVAHDRSKPFIVQTGDQTVEVLGTHFNINAYPEEGILTTTLLEGKVKVAMGRSAELLSPGEQALVSGASKSITVHEADTELAVAWKNGYFRFKNEDIRSVMRKLGRWYNVEVVFEGPIPEEKFTGTISKYKNISQVLHMLQYSQSVHFKLEGRRLTVSK